MKKTLLAFSLLYFASFSNVFANYTTPGTGGKYNMDDLVTLSGGNVTLGAEFYNVNDTVTISLLDTLYINTNVTVKFFTNTYFNVLGTVIINPPTGVLFTAQDPATRFFGMSVTGSSSAVKSSVIRKLTMEYGTSVKFLDCSPTVDSCTFRFNTFSSTFGSYAVSLFRSNATITNCSFTDNYRPAIGGGANIDNAPLIANCFMKNNCSTAALNQPQINLGGCGINDTTKIIGNTIIGGQIKSGGIALSPIGGTVRAVISGNLIRANRYGMTFSGGTAINVLVSYNLVDSNNIENLPNLGGSGIAFTGGSTTSHQNAIVTGNIFRANLYGITIQNFAKPNLGNITNSDTTDDGKNQFINNVNATYPQAELFNNSPDSIWAQNNYWGAEDSISIENKITHKPDNATYGLVTFSGFMTIPVGLSKFIAIQNKDNNKLFWETSSESNSSHFEIEKSLDGRNFYQVGNIAAAGNSSTARAYNFVDNNVTNDKTAFYRLRQVDKDGRFTYSWVVSVRTGKSATSFKLYPTILSPSGTINATVVSAKEQTATILFMNADGKLTGKRTQQLLKGNNNFVIDAGGIFSTGLNYVRLIADGVDATSSVVVK